MAAPVYIEETVSTVLKASSAVSALCSGKVFPLRMPQGTVLPAVVYKRTGTTPNNTVRGCGSESVVLLVNCFAQNYGEAKNLALAVRSVMVAAPINAILRNETHLYEENAGVDCISTEYLCQQSGGY